jgi:hypothetical protein
MLINCVVTPYNLYTIHNLLDYFITRGIPVKLHPTDYPNHFSIANIPNSLKTIFLEQLHLRTFPQEYQDEVDNVESVLMKEDDPHTWELFLKTTVLHDTYRNESYETTFPEFFNIINCNGK